MVHLCFIGLEDFLKFCKDSSPWMAIFLETMIWDNPKFWKSFAINQPRIMGIIPHKFNLDYTTTNELERKVFLTSEGQHVTEEMFTNGKHQIVNFGNKEGAL